MRQAGKIAVRLGVKFRHEGILDRLGVPFSRVRWGFAIQYVGVAHRRIETEVDRLYQLPPDEFTAARNALAKEAGADRAEVRGLGKPPIAAWAVNQLYWKRRDVYDPLIAASIELRKHHKAVLAGRTADIRDAGKD